MNYARLNELKEAKYLLEKQIQATTEQITVHYTNIKKEEIKLKNLGYELKGIEEKIKEIEEESI